jgi:hypothetical protein
MIAYAYLRSSITNGGRLLPNVDGRTFWVRRYRHLFALLVSDLGGADAMEMQFAQAGEAPPEALDVHQRVTNSLTRLHHKLWNAPAPIPNPELPQRL